jgi:hypothetical protein
VTAVEVVGCGLLGCDAVRIAIFRVKVETKFSSGTSLTTYMTSRCHNRKPPQSTGCFLNLPNDRDKKRVTTSRWRGGGVVGKVVAS